MNMTTMNMTPPIIAIDGYAASGKGTLARALAPFLDFAYLDTGRLYRAIAYLALNSKGHNDDPKKIAALASKITPELLANPALTDEEVGGAASKYATAPEVRAALFDFQQGFATNPPDGKKGAILDGRDIGTVICPNAPLKLFITASAKVRATRRHQEMLDKGVNSDYEHVLAAVKARDHQDETRPSAPLKQAPDAHVIDTSLMTPDQVLAAALKLAHQHGWGRG